MPPASRGRTLFHVCRRDFSLKISQKPTNPSRIPHLPSRKPQQKPAASNNVPDHNKRLSRFGRLLLYAKEHRTKILRLALLCPIFGVALLHSPYEMMRVNGRSMSPLLNPNYDADTDLPNSHMDRILVQKHSLPDFVADINASRKARRKAQEQPVADEQENTSTGFQRGQVVTFYTPHSPDKIAVKRIVGLPGDRIQPLPGYPGGEDAITIPWNHLWVEGDGETGQQKLDSNWYGPISQNLIIGEVKAVLTPWWKPSWLSWKHHKWPALEQGRVEEAVIAEAANDPQVVTILREWTDGTNQERLAAMRQTPETFAAYFTSSEDVRARVRQFYRNAALILARDDPDSERFELAQDIIKEMEKIYGVGALRQGMIKRSSKPAISASASQDQKEALAAEKLLRAQGWTIDRDDTGKARTISIET